MSFELLFVACGIPFVADEIWVFVLDSSRNQINQLPATLLRYHAASVGSGSNL